MTRFRGSHFIGAVSLSILAGSCILSSSAANLVGSPESDGKSTASINVGYMDKEVSPCSDFFVYANGSWMKNTPVPAEYDKWGVLNIIDDRNLTLLRKLMEEAAAKHDAVPGSNEQKVGDFFATGMDTEKIEKDGVQPLSNYLKKIDEMKTLEDLRSQVAQLHKQGVNLLFNFESGQDFKDSTKVIAQIYQSGLGLPERDYYVNPDDHSVKLREQYVDHVSKMLVLIGEAPDQAAKSAQKIMAIETKLAEGSMPNTETRNPDNVYHKMELSDLKKLAPHFGWTDYFRETGYTEMNSMNVGMPEFMKKLDEQLTAFSIDDWKEYLKWHLVDTAAPCLSSKFVDEDFNFHGKILTGKQENLPRWKRIVRATNGAMGEAVGEQYVKATFTPAAKARALDLVKRLKETLKEDLAKLEWMDEKTRQNALAKFSAFGLKIGYPDKWRDYSKLKVDRESFVGNVFKANEFEFNRQLAKIGKPVDRTEWFMSPQTVNAYYSSEMNEIVFPAGILQPPIFDPKADDATNLGAMGMIIGHEMTHGFDDQGSKFDGQGNLKNWWSPDDLKRFKERIALIEKQYDSYTVAGGVHEKGKLVAGEAAADLGGVTLAYKTLLRSLESHPEKVDVNGFTPQQRFFLSFAQAWATNVRPEKERLMAATDPHPVPHYRVNGTIANMDAFEKAFPSKENCTIMLPTDQRCRLW